MNARTRTSRRQWLVSTAAASLALAQRSPLAADQTPRTIGLGFSLYGMKTMSIAEGLKTCAVIGYDCVELPVMTDWPADSAKLTPESRREIRDQLAERGLRLTALMENLPALGDEPSNLDRLRRAAELAPEFKVNDHVPLVETIIGGKAGEWESVKDRLAERLRAWAEVMGKAEVKLAIKAHVSNAAQRPEQLLWLLEQVASPWLVAAYDYSHFQLQDLKMAETMSALLPRSAFIHVKDSQRMGEKWKFSLPGEGSIDYVEYFRLLAKSQYRGDVVVEVSGQVSSQPGYDPVAAARKCYNHLAPAMKEAGLTRG